MSSTYSNLKIQLMATGENASTWGDVTNTNLGTAIEEAIAGSADVTFASNNVTLTLSDTNGTQTARNMRLNLVGTTGGSTRNLIVPSIEKAYIVNNTCGDSVVVKTSAGTGVTVPAGKTMWVYSNATNVVDVTTHLTALTLGSPLPVASGGTGSNTGNAGSLTGLNASNVTTGTLVVAYGGTGSGTASGARVNLLPSYTGNAGKLLALNSGGTDVEWVSAGGAGTVTSVNATTAISGLSFSGGPVTSAGTLTLSGTLGVQGGGTGTTSLSANALVVGNGTSAVTTIAPGTNGQVLTSNGTNWYAATPSGGSGTVTSVSGTGSVNGITLSGTVTSSGSLTLGGSLSGVSLSSQVSGTLPIGNGGTGVTTTPSSGQLLIGNGSGFTLSTLTAGSGVTITNSAGGITIAASGGGGGTVTLNNGSVSSPSLNFTSSSDTGMYMIPASGFTGSLNLAVDGLLGLAIHSNVSVSPNSLSVGYNAGAGIGTGSQNCTAIGYSTIATATAGDSNTAVGSQALNKVTGTTNTGIGVAAGFNLSSGANNTLVGYLASPSSNTVSNEITLGNSSVTALRCQVTTITSLSDARDKKDITALDAGLDFINALNPVRFTWNMRPTEGIDGEMVEGRKDDPDTGFIAQDLKAVQEQLGIVIPGLVYDNNPEKLEAGYGKLLPVLVKAIQELSAKVDALEAQLGG